MKQIILAGFVASVIASAAHAAGKAADGWPYFGGTRHLDRYSPLAQVDASNVSRLATVWTRPGLDASLTEQFPDLSPSPYLRGTPIMIDGVLYSSDQVGLVEAFDAVSGKTLWVQKPFEATLKEASGQSARGVEFWKSGGDARIFSVRGEYLYALNAKDGALITTFGEKGRVNLNRHTADNAPYFNWNGPIVVGDVIVIGGNGGGKAGGGYGDGGDLKEAAPEDIRGYDTHTGKQLWQFHILPHAGEPGHETWGNGSADNVGNMGEWAPLSADEEVGYVYVPLTAPTASYYGGHRPGNNLYANSLVVLNAKTGKLVWHFQMVHHDLWDYDDASAPTLGEVTVDGKRIKAVFQPNKTGYLFAFDRVTGKPLWPIVEKPVPAALLPGEHSSPTQPVPSRPAPFDRQGITADDLIDFTPQLHAEAVAFIKDYVTGPLFTTPSLKDDPATGKKGTLQMPGAWGTGNWNTNAFDPETGIFYAVSMSLPGLYAMVKPTDAAATIGYAFPEGGARGANAPARSIYGPGPQMNIPLVKPPYGRITAIDMNKGENLWTVANGDGPRNEPALKDLHLPPLGTLGRPVPLLTKSLLFVGEASDALFGKAGVTGAAKFYAYDKKTGKVVWQMPLPDGTTGGPITYMAKGKQYIVIPYGGKDSSGWMALALKN